MLIVWTAYPQHCEDLKQFLNDRLTTARPIAVLGLEKEKFLNVNSGAITNAAGLRTELVNRITSIPQLSVLLEWETDVLLAAGKTLGSLLTLIPTDKRNTESYSSELDNLLSRLACAAVGPDNVEKDPRAALVQALLPILADRIVNRWSFDGLEVWKLAITKHGNQTQRGGVDSDKGHLNRMMHLAPVGKETFGPSDWGSIVTFPYSFEDTAMTEHFGMTVKELFEEFKVKEGDRAKCTPVLIRVGAVCDFAQKHAGPIPYLFGIEVPQNIKQDKLSPAIWKSPLFTDDSSTVYKLQVHIRFREQILMELIAAQAGYISRPGIIRFD
jgi:hypothetical protein